MHSGTSESIRRYFDWLRRHRLLASALLLALLSAGAVPFLVSAVTFPNATVFLNNVGIGTTIPNSPLQISSTSDQKLYLSGSASPRIILDSTTGDDYFIDIVGGLRIYNNTDSRNEMQFDGAGHVGIGTASPGYPLHVVSATHGGYFYQNGNPNVGYIGVIGYTDQAGNYGGLLQSAASGGNYCYFGMTGGISGSCSATISGASDARLKNIIAPLNPGDTLAGIMQLQPISYRWKDENRNASATSTQLGFTAQNVQQYFPQLVSWAPQGSTTKSAFVDGPILALSYDRLIVPAIAALQELNVKLEDLATAAEIQESPFTTRFFSALFSRITQWFASAENGIRDFYAGIVHAKEGDFSDRLCIGSTCVTESQLKAMIAESAAAGASASPAPMNPAAPLPL